MLSNFDQRMVHFHGNSSGSFKSSANSASRGRGGSSRRGGFSRGRGRSSGGGNSGGSNSRNGGRAPANKTRRGRGNPRARLDAPRCQICGKLGHTAKDCWYRYEEDDDSSQDDDKVAAAADGSYGIDTNWYVDSGATNHITNELEKVTMKEKYRG